MLALDRSGVSTSFFSETGYPVKNGTKNHNLKKARSSTNIVVWVTDTEVVMHGIHVD